MRRREPARRPLNVARPLFTKRGLAAFHATARARARRALCARYGAAVLPARPRLGRAARARGARRAASASRHGRSNGAEQVICATGFQRGFEHDPLLARARRRARASRPRSAGSSSPTTRPCPALTDATRTLALAGVPAQWAFPAADTLVGMKVAARGFRRGSSHVLHAERPNRDAARGRAAAVPRRRRALARSCTSGGRSSWSG